MTQADMVRLKLHKYISFIKSVIRIAGYILLPTSVMWAASVLIFAETLGILEEVVV